MPSGSLAASPVRFLPKSMPKSLSIETAKLAKTMSRNNRLNKEPRTEKFRLSLVDDTTHRHIWTLRFTRWTFFLTVISIITVLLVGAFAVFALTPLKSFIPGYPDEHARRAAVQNAVRIDSLENVIIRWEFYSENLLKVMEGKDPVRIDSLVRSAHAEDVEAFSREYLAQQDSTLRQTVREGEKFGLSTSTARHLPIEGMHFFTPLKGVVATPFDAIEHPGIDISAPSGSVVMSVLAGTVVSALWSDDEGYTIIIQHSDDVISVYRHNQKLLKKEGDKVSAGASVALVGNAGLESQENHLHFELWYRGEAVDPAKYITF